MALKAKVANKVQTTVNGLVEGTITRVLEIDEHTEIEKGKEVKYKEQFEFQIEAEGSQKNVTYRIWTPQSFNNEKYENPNNKTIDYNKLTRLILQLELISEADLKEDLESLKDFDVEQCEGLKIQFELEPHKENKNFKVPKLTSIKPVKPPK